MTIEQLAEIALAEVLTDRGQKYFNAPLGSRGAAMVSLREIEPAAIRIVIAGNRTLHVTPGMEHEAIEAINALRGCLE